MPPVQRMLLLQDFDFWAQRVLGHSIPLSQRGRPREEYDPV
jgi:hypothetical protein